MVYTVYSDNACTTALTANNSPSTVAVTNRSVATSARITINLAGTVYWRIVYSGDANHNGAQSPCTSQAVAKSNPSLARTTHGFANENWRNGVRTGDDDARRYDGRRGAYVHRLLQQQLFKCVDCSGQPERCDGCESDGP